MKRSSTKIIKKSVLKVLELPHDFMFFAGFILRRGIQGIILYMKIAGAGFYRRHNPFSLRDGDPCRKTIVFNVQYSVSGKPFIYCYRMPVQPIRWRVCLPSNGVTVDGARSQKHLNNLV